MTAKTCEVTKTLDLGVLGERDCKIHFTYSPGRPGTWYRRNGDPGDPPEPAEVCVTGIYTEGVDLYELCAGYLENDDSFLEAASEVYEAANSPEAA